MFGVQVFCYKMMYVDFNFGNYVFWFDGKIVFYDYGCVKKFFECVVFIYRDMVEVIYQENYIWFDWMLMLFGVRVFDLFDVFEEFYE